MAQSRPSPENVLREVRQSLETLSYQLQSELITNPRDQEKHKTKMKLALIDLEAMDRRLLETCNSLMEEEQDDLESNFGVSLKLEMAQSALSMLKEKHSSLRKEWYSQDEHLRKLTKKICDTEKQFKSQRIACATQGLLFSKVLWKFSKSNNLLEIIVSHENLVLDLLKIYTSTLCGFTNESMNTSSDDYQYLLSLTGIINNFATIPDGRFFLINQPICQNAINQVIKSIPQIQSPLGEDLKFLLLTLLYNIMICKEGEEVIRNDCCLNYSLTSCISPPQSARLTILAMKIMKGAEKRYCPVEAITKLRSGSPTESRKDEAKLKKDCCAKDGVVRKISRIRPAEGAYPNNILAYYLLTNTYFPCAPSNNNHATLTEASSSRSETRACEMSDLQPRRIVNESKSTSMSRVLVNLREIGQGISDEIHSMRYQLPNSNLGRTFSITIGDNLQISIPAGNLTKLSGGCCFGDDIKNTSIVTVYRKDDGQLNTFSDNTILPFVTVTCNDASTAIDESKAATEVIDVGQFKTDIGDEDVQSTSIRGPTFNRKKLHKKKRVRKLIAKTSYFKRKRSFKRTSKSTRGRSSCINSDASGR
uniref:Uncharacterized protein n=1 Tax=Photinus pyralis TaxID=7054 RepID=A0A1Y1KY93_PHOPY